MSQDVAPGHRHHRAAERALRRLDRPQPRRDTRRAMSRENVDLVAGGLREFNTTRRPPAVMAPDFVWDMSAFEGWPDEPQYRGAGGFMEFFAKWTEPYDEWHPSWRTWCPPAMIAW